VKRAYTPKTQQGSLSRCQAAKPLSLPFLPIYAKSFPAMGCIVSLTVYAPMTMGNIFKEVQERTLTAEKFFSRRIAGSGVSAINSSQGKFVKVDASTNDLLLQALHYARLTDRAYNPAVGALVNLWDIKTSAKNPNSACLPDKTRIAETLKSCSLENIETDFCGSWRALNRTQIDLDSIAKGYCAWQICSLCKERGIESALISFGTSSIGALGLKPDGSAWKVGLRTPQPSLKGCFGTLNLKDNFLSVSGSYEQGFIKDGKLYHHILNVKTGCPSDSGLKCVTVICDDGAKSEAYSTALFSMGLEKALDFHKTDASFEAVFVTNENRVICTKNLVGNFKLLKTNAECIYC
jgi:thiamine biosynthesis lipoprotein